ncbi:MAG: DUF3048 domain-containing protein [Patescibacteria group bacterium]
MVKKVISSEQPPRRTYWQLLVGFLLVVAGILLVVVSSLIQYFNANPGSLDDALTPNTDTENRQWFFDDSEFTATFPSHPVAVMIDNHFEVWDHQYGLSFAPVVYSTLVEGGTTRFMAVFDLSVASDAVIGPVRSVRPYYIPWAAEYDALLVHVGGSPDALALLQAGAVDNLNEMTSYGPLYFYRDDRYIAPHSTFTTAPDIREALLERGLFNEEHLDVSHFSFLFEKPKPAPTEVEEILIDYSDKRTYDATYVWNEDQGAYMRLRVDEPQVDAYNGKVIGIDNVVIQRVPPEDVLDADLRIALEIIGNGEAVFFMNGRVVKGTWKKEEQDLPTRFYDNEGNEMSFVPGNVWVEVVPESVEVVY